MSASAPGLSNDELLRINACVLKGWPLGSDDFKRDVQHKAQRQVLPARRGRPPKQPAPEPA